MQVRPALTPAAIRPRLDLSTIDNEKKAAVLPALNGATYDVMLAALDVASAGGVVVDSLLQETIDNTPQSSISSNNGDTPTALAGSGTFGNAAFQETWSADPSTNTVKISGRIGSSDEALVLTRTGNTAHLDGTVGTVEVHETIVTGNNGALMIDGTLNRVPIHQQVTVNPDAMPIEPTTIKNVVTVSGTLGSDPISFSEDAVYPPFEPIVTYTGQGNIAGTPVALNHTLQISALPTDGQSE